MNKLKVLSVSLLLVFMAAGAGTAGAGSGVAEPVLTASVSQIAPISEGEKFASDPAEFAEFLRKAVEDYLAGQMPETIVDWKLVKMSWNKTEKMPKEYDDFKLSQISSSTNGDQRVVSVEFVSNDKVIKKLQVSCKVEMYAEAVVAKAGITHGTAITEANVEIAKVLVDVPVSELIGQTSDVVGTVAQRNLLPGKVVRKSQLGRAMDIKAGDLVVIQAKNSVVQLTARGIARKEGTIGEMIPVVNLRSNKKLFAKIVDGGTVEVEF